MNNINILNEGEREPISPEFADDLESIIRQRVTFPIREGLHEGILNLETIELVGGKLPVNITLCPLYGNSLEGNDFLTEGDGKDLTQSRVYIKLEAQIEVMRAIQEICMQRSIDISWNITFADLGVIVSSEHQFSNEAINRILDYHLLLYKDFLSKYIDINDINWIKYSEISTDSGFELPKYIIQGGEPYDDKNEIHRARLEDFVAKAIQRGALSRETVNPETGQSNRRFRQNFASLSRNGIEFAMGMINQYITFDGRSTGLNIYLERSTLYLATLNGMGRARNLSRVEILCVKDF